jgi:ribosomal protein S18 acetylase RimI-like enzyme
MLGDRVTGTEEELSVRPLGPGDELDRLVPAWGPALAESDAPAGQSVPLVIEDRARRIRALAVCRRVEPALRVEALHLDSIGAADALVALARTDRSRGLELLVEARLPGEARTMAQASAQAELRRVLDQGVYEGLLDGVVRPERRMFTFRRSDELGPASLIAVLGASWGGERGPSARIPAHELEALLALASGEHGPDTSLWRVAYCEGELAGVALALRHPGGAIGTVLYLGLLPWARGRGLGGALHEETLWQLRCAGARVYRDATAVDNGAAIAILHNAGCERVGTSTLYASNSCGIAPGDPDMAFHLPIPGAPRSLLTVPMNTTVRERDIH